MGVWTVSPPGLLSTVCVVGVTLPPAGRPRGTQEGVQHGKLSACGERALHTVFPGILQTCSAVASVSLTALTLCQWPVLDVM